MTSRVVDALPRVQAIEALHGYQTMTWVEFEFKFEFELQSQFHLLTSSPSTRWGSL